MADNPMKKLREEINQGPKPKRISKSNRTLYVTEPQFSEFAADCRAKGWSPSEVLDRLIALYLAELHQDFQPDVPKPPAK
jgi:hypothetical protein